MICCPETLIRAGDKLDVVTAKLVSGANNKKRKRGETKKDVPMDTPRLMMRNRITNLDRDRRITRSMTKHLLKETSPDIGSKKRKCN